MMSLNPKQEKEKLSKHWCSIISNNDKKKLRLQKNKQYENIQTSKNASARINNCDQENPNESIKIQTKNYSQFKAFNQKIYQQIIHFLQVKLIIFSQTAGLTTFINNNQPDNRKIIQHLKNKLEIAQHQISKLIKTKESFSSYEPELNCTLFAQNQQQFVDRAKLIQWNSIILQTVSKINQIFQIKNFDKDLNMKDQPNNTQDDFVFVSPKIQKSHFKSSHFNSTNNATFQSGKATKRQNQVVQRKDVSINQFKEKQSAFQMTLLSNKIYNQSNIQNNLNQLNFQSSSPIRQENDYVCQQIQNNEISDNQLALHNTNRNQLQKYFYSFLICFSAQKKQYSQWVQDLLNQLQLDNLLHKSSQQHQLQLVLCTQNVLDKLIQILRTKYKSNKFLTNEIDNKDNSDSIFVLNKQYDSVMYFSEDITFVKLIIQFLLVNISQIHKRLQQFIKNAEYLLEITETISNIKEERQSKQNQFFQKYLPSADDSLEIQANNQKNQEIWSNQYFTFNQKQLQNLLYQNKKNIVLKKSLFNIFDKAIRKICFNRIKYCRRFDFDAVQRISQVLNNLICYKEILNNSFMNLKNNFQEQLRSEQHEQATFQKMMKFKLQKVFFEWKKIKINKQKILRNILKRKNKNIQKNLFLCLSRWRLNTRRNNLNQKIMQHSNSCNFLMTKYSSTICRNQVTNYKNSKTQFEKSYVRRSASNLKLKNQQIFLNQESQIKRRQTMKNQQRRLNENRLTVKYDKLNNKRINDEYQRKVKQRLRGNYKFCIKN